jgi:tetratricopeptide (TPR) repeat protein/TolB-like protein
MGETHEGSAKAPEASPDSSGGSSGDSSGDAPGDASGNAADSGVAPPQTRDTRPARPPRVVASSPTGLREGHVLAGRYRIVRFLAEGGMGEVYEAEDLELGGRVALKSLLPEIARDEQAIARFKREVQLARRVTHPNVCRLFEFGVDRRGTGDGIVFLTMEMIPGETLWQRLLRLGPLSPSDGLSVARQLASGIDSAHRAGVVHRDFKSPNVILMPTGDATEPMRAVITDFGLARESLAEEAQSNITLSTSGTPGYMAPEQVQGGVITRAVDIYAFGVVLFEVIQGPRKRPESPLGLLDRGPHIDARWREAIRRCLDPRPERRPASASAVVDILSGDATRRAHRVRRLVWLATGLVAVTGVTAVAALRHAHLPASGAASLASVGPTSQVVATTLPTRRPTVAVLGFRNLSGQTEAAWLSTALGEMLTSELGADMGLRLLPEEEIGEARRDLDWSDDQGLSPETLERIRLRLGTDFVVLGSYVAENGQAGPLRVDVSMEDAQSGEIVGVVHESGDVSQVIALATKAGTALRRQLGGSTAPMSEVPTAVVLPEDASAARAYAEGLAADRSIDLQDARAKLQQATALAPDFPLAHDALCNVLLALGQQDQARDEGQRAFDLSSGLARDQRLRIEADYREATGDWARGEEIYRTLWTQEPDDVGYWTHLAFDAIEGGDDQTVLDTVGAVRALPDEGDDPVVDQAVANADEDLGDYPGERTAATQGLAAAEATGARREAAVLEISEGRADDHLGALDAELAAYRDAESRFTAVGDTDGKASAVQAEGGALEEEGKLDAALAAYQSALTTFRAEGSLGGIASTEQTLALVLDQQGKLGDARAMAEDSVAVAGKAGDPYNAAVASQALGSIELRLGDVAAARKAYNAALATLQAEGATVEAGRVLSDLGNLELQTGDLDVAKDDFSQSLAIFQKAGEQPATAIADTNLGNVLTLQGDLPTARADCARAQTIDEAAGSPQAAAEDELCVGDVDARGARFADAEKEARDALAVFAPQGGSGDRVSALELLARALLGQGRTAEAASTIAEAQAGETSVVPLQLEVAITAARIQATQGSASEAVSALRATIARATSAGLRGEALDGRLALGEVELASGDVTNGRAALASLAADAASGGYARLAQEAAKDLAPAPVAAAAAGKP